MYIIQVYRIFHYSTFCICIIFIICNGFCIFSYMYSKCASNVSLVSIYIPRYLYFFTTGISIILKSFLIFSSILFLLCSRIPDFELFIYMLFFYAQSWQIFIAFFNSSSDIPVIARSSAYANVFRFSYSNSSSRSLNITRNSVGDKTPPYITPLPTL